MSNIPRKPERAPTYDPDDPRFWDERDLEKELRRTFQVCHECRMCVTYCGSFPFLLNAVDRDIDAGRAVGAEALALSDMSKVTDLCWQCKLCYINCPYTPDEQAYEALDFPRLMFREKTVRARRNGIPIVDQVLGEPQLVGKAGAGPQAPMANLVNANRLVRKVMEKATGISAEFPLPAMAREPFASWMEKHQAPATAGSAGTVVLFATCYGDYNYPGVPQAAVRVLEHNGFRVVRPEQTCCGLPNLDGGDIASFRKKVELNVASILPWVKDGAIVVTPGPSCGYTIKKDWPQLLKSEDVSRISAATMDLMEFLDKLRRDKKLSKEFTRGFGKVAYHAPCHLRAQKIGTPGARLLGLLPDTKVDVVAECSAVDGTWGMKAEYYDMGRRYAQKMVRGIDDAEAQLVVSDCSLASLRIARENGVEVLHPVEALALGYGLPLDRAERPGSASKLETGGIAMKKVERGEILPLADYEVVRERFRMRIIEEKKHRRARLGEHISCVFENHDTALLQIQEMLRTERITREGAVQHEIDTYNELVPGPDELSATLFVEIPDRELRDRMLVELAGLEACFYVELDGTRHPGRNETRGVMPDRTTAVHYVKFPLGEGGAASLRTAKQIVVGVDHPRYRARAELSVDSKRSLVEDLDG